MGNHNSKLTELQQLNHIIPSNWTTIQKQGNFQHVIDAKGNEGTINVLELNPIKKMQTQLQIYYYRKTYQGPLVKCYGAETLKSGTIGVCGVKNVMKVITQRIIKTWYQLPQLTFNEILYAIGECLSGYQTLFRQVGPFQVTHNMIGVNNRGQVKVWLNQNFADNSPSLQKGVLYTTTDSNSLFGNNTQIELLGNILKIIQQRCEQGHYPPDFGHFIEKRSDTFDEAINAVAQYIRNGHLQLPNAIHPDPGMMYKSTMNLGVKSAQSSYYQKSASPLRMNERPNYGSQNKNIQEFSLNKQTVYETKYLNNRNEDMMTPKKPLYEQKNIHQGDNRGNRFELQGNRGYQTGVQINPQSQPQWGQFDVLKQNPNIQAAESVYEASRMPSSANVEQSNRKSINTASINYNYNNNNNNNNNHSHSHSGSKPKVNFGYQQSSNNNTDRKNNSFNTFNNTYSPAFNQQRHIVDNSIASSQVQKI